MLTHRNDYNGFKISIKSQTAEEHIAGSTEPFTAKELGAQIAKFIESMLAPGQELNIAMSIEKWDDIFVLEESFYRVSPLKNGGGENDYRRNYWIETNNN
jgi:hypothetical protein